MTEATEAFWSGDFGTEYTDRNQVDFQDRLPFWEDVITWTMPKTVLEVGCNAGHNLMAIKHIAPGAYVQGVDINESALEKARAKGLSVVNMPARNVGDIYSNFDLVFTAGLLIHISPKEINAVIESLVRASSKWILAIEYAAVRETEVNYRGHADRLWKRPYGENLKAHGLYLADWGDAGPGFDRCTYFLCEKD